MISRTCWDTIMEQEPFFFTELFVLLTASVVFSKRSVLYLNVWEFIIVNSSLLGGTSSLLNCHKFPD